MGMVCCAVHGKGNMILLCSSGISVSEVITAVITSLIASVMFWVVFNVIPDLRERKKMKPLIDFDLYQICWELAAFLELPFNHSMRSPALNQHQIYYGKVTKEEYRRILYTKCLTEEYQQIDDVAKNLIPIGEELDKRSKEILECIQKIYVFNKYLTAEQILLCRRIADKITVYSYDMPAFMKNGDRVMTPLDPTLTYMSEMFFDLHQLYMRLQNYLIKQKGSENDLGDFYQHIYYRMLDVLYLQEQYKQILKITKGKQERPDLTYYFRSLLHLGRTDEALFVIKQFLQSDNLFLISLRSYFSEFLDDERVKQTLISARSLKEYQEMIDCIQEEDSFFDSFLKAADEIKAFYEKKLSNHIKANAIKMGMDIKEV